ncbi:biopolymer transporter ExbD [Bremerella sp. JC817]|uniref:ExbD/TolR family protein n=1 Tax=Bremerella sp. JC817 TaxID=3231756 RepID=UPI003457918D
MKLSSHKRAHKRQITLEMTSMIDVVFLLLIFFIVTASFTKTERDLDAVTKVNEKSSAASETDLEPAIVLLANVDGSWVYQIGTNNLTTFAELEEVLNQFPNKEDGAFVRAPDAAPYGMAAAAIQACKNAEFPGVSYVPLTPP